jgi:hypothetical protein
LRETRGVRRRRSIEEWRSTEGAHRRGRTTVTHGWSPARRRGSGGGKPARRMPGQWERMCGARAWTDETNGVRGEKIFLAGGRRLRFNRNRREGGPGGVDAVWRRSGSLAWHGVVRRCGVGMAAARPRHARATHCRATVENGRVGATRGDVANRWAGTLRGPGRQRLGAAWGSAVRRSARH